MLKLVRLLLVMNTCAAFPCAAFAASSESWDVVEERDGYQLTRSPPISELMRGAIRQADGSMLIPMGGHSPEANRYHAALCESYGGVDITDLGDVRFRGIAGDGFSCEFSDPQAAREFLARQQPPFATENPVDSQGRLLRWVPVRPAPHSPISHSSSGTERQPPVSSDAWSSPLIIEPHAAQGTATKGLMYYPSSYVDYYNIPSEAEFSVDSVVYEVDPCQWSQGGLMKPASYHSIGLFVACVAGRNQAAKSRITGCHGPACNTDEQWVLHQEN